MALRDLGAAYQRGEVDGVCILAWSKVSGCTQIFNTIEELGELSLARDELSDMIDQNRRGN